MARIEQKLAKIDSVWVPEGLWTSAHIPGGSHRDLLEGLVRDGVPELSEIALTELRERHGDGTTLRDLLDLTARSLQAVERRLKLEERVQRAMVDPLNRATSTVAMLVAAVRLQNPQAEDVLSDMVGDWIRRGDSDSMVQLAKLTGSPPGEEHRVHRMLLLVLDFHSRHHRFPTFAEARAIVFSREEAEARDPSIDRWAQLFPPKHDSKEWKRLWEQCGLEWLEKGKPGRPRKK